jgi:membrane-associated PAP2 superfamily phosphatase
MNRAGLAVTLAIAAVIGIVFAVAPELDLRLSRPFFEISYRGLAFGLRLDPVLWTLRDSGIWLSTVLAAPAAGALVLKLVLPRRKLLVSGRAIVFLLGTLALAPGVLVNVILKEHWDRPRPIDIKQFGGTQTYMPWWDPRGDCPENCSFVSGDVSGSYWMLAPAALAPPPWRAFAYAGALAAGAGMSLLRVAAGAHFFTDVVFAGVFTFLIVWIVHGLVYRWPSTRLTDDGIEHAIERVALPPHEFIAGLFRKRTPR